MKVNVRVIPNSKKEDIVIDGEKLKIHLKAKAINNEANKSLIELLSEHYNKRKSEIKIVRGLKSRNKVVKIL
ncbi:MAG: hypothetical protein QT11_C0001G0316 [archaeon GW2011_AR20]|nr:MAG: hypothetical protein QT11_C0001G0316 [archaeon GW2011_AR20]AQS27992.1 hypothetical protein [uncultured archaeon]AQS28484.1 hypothetical protein [uncultured archaeon]MBS3160324.1 DUF167 domain-containing protein [Candidatus Woesearchaeota archaeon]